MTRDAEGARRSRLALMSGSTWFWRAVAVATSWLVRLLVRTFRVTFYGPEPCLDRPTVFAFHHGRQLGLLRHPRPDRTVVLSSLSRDGALQAMILGALGFGVVRGSSSRGADAGLVALVRAVRSGASAAIAVDGPRGPRGVVKPGAVYVASASQGVVVPITCAASRALQLTKSWDRFLVPVPWSRVTVVRGRPLTLGRHSSESEMQHARSTLERELEELTERAEALARSQERRSAA